MNLSTFPPTNPSMPRTLHIVLVTETWLPDINGVASSLFYLMQSLKQAGHRITLVMPEPLAPVLNHSVFYQSPTMAMSNSVIDDIITVKALPIPYYSHLRMGLPNKRMLHQTFADIKPDIVHIATEGPLGWVALKVAKKLKIHVCSGYHTSFDDFSRHFGGRLLPSAWLATAIMHYLKYFHNGCDATCVPSEKTLRQLQQQGIKNLHLVGRGINKQLFCSDKRSQMLRQSWQAGEETTVLLYVGRVSPEKGIDTVIQGFKALQYQQLYRHVKLVIVGDGPAKAPLMQKYQLANANPYAPHDPQDINIIFTGFQTGDDLAMHYASADAFIFASQVETFGNVVVEAMASGLPVFAYKDAAAAMLVDTSCGDTVAVGQENAFIDMVANLPKLQQLHAMRATAEQKVADFSWQTPANAMLAMFYQVLGCNPTVENLSVLNVTAEPMAVPQPKFLPALPKNLLTKPLTHPLNKPLVQ